MRLFAYYVGHTFVNVIKKLMKTWVAIILIMILAGAIFGVVGGIVADSIHSSMTTEEGTGDGSDDPGDVDVVEEPAEDTFEFELFGFLKDLDRDTITELAISALILLMLAITLLNGKGLEEVFQPADVPILFSAPMKPQSVMMFRLTTTLGMQVFFSLIMAFQIPNLTLNAGLPMFGAISLIIGWMLLALFSTLIQVFLYCISSNHETLKKNMKLYVGIFFAVIAAGYLFCVLQNDKDLLKAAVVMFTGANGYWVPFFGWIRGFCMNAISGNILWSMIFLALVIAGLVGMVAVIWRLKVDFYEDAMVAAERKAKKLAKAAGTKGEVIERDKARSEKLSRDGFRYGKGANVFFFKTLYNRFRLSWFRFLTKTMLLYVGITLFLIVLAQIKDFPYAFLVICCAMTGIAFFRTLGNPLMEDINKDLFLMVPATARQKLFWSILGGVTNTALDMIIAYVAAVICTRPSIPDAILWFLFILTIDLYGTITNTFVNLSVAMKLPKTMQTMIQVMFIYFGITPAIVFIILGLILGNFTIFLGIGILANIAVSFFLFMLTPLFLQNGRK